MANKLSKEIKKTNCAKEQFHLFPQCFKGLVLQTHENNVLSGNGLMVCFHTKKNSDEIR